MPMPVTCVVLARKATVLGITLSASLGATMCLLLPTALQYTHGFFVALFLAVFSGLTTVISP